ncbi:MAG TPA: hypothetical protein VGF82_20740 [Terracidiphilus sp.]
MLDRWRFAIVLSLFGFLASGALMVHVMMGGYSDIDTRWGWAINVVCPAHILITQYFAFQNDGTPLMTLLWVGTTVLNGAIWFAVGAMLTKLVSAR